MSTYFLHRDAFLCPLDGGVVFLDARRCEYLAVGTTRVADLAEGLAGWLATGPTTADKAPARGAITSPLLADLVRRGILTTSVRDGKPAQPVSLAALRALPSAAYSAITTPSALAALPSFLTALGRAAVRLRQRNLLQLLRRIEMRKAHAQCSACRRYPDVALLVNRFNRLRVWFYSAENACLKDSLILADFLLSCGALPTLVIGVRSRPFAAHAWVQCGDMVLNDALETVQRYTPIVAI